MYWIDFIVLKNQCCVVLGSLSQETFEEGHAELVNVCEQANRKHDVNSVACFAWKTVIPVCIRWETPAFWEIFLGDSGVALGTDMHRCRERGSLSGAFAGCSVSNLRIGHKWLL
jgi:hypothetical protein